jgi:TRAP-type C4-dicarboxylate transport system permease small subunit
MDYRSHYPVPLRLLSKLIDLCLVLGGLSIVTLVFTNAMLRGAAGFDLAWSLEVTAFLLLWTTFLGAAAAMARGAHMRVTEIAENLVPLPAQRWLALAIDGIVLVMLLTLIWYGTSIAGHSWAQRTTVLYWPVGLLYASMPAGMACALIFHLFNMFHDVRHAGDGPVDGPGDGSDIGAPS